MNSIGAGWSTKSIIGSTKRGSIAVAASGSDKWTNGSSPWTTSESPSHFTITMASRSSSNV